MSTIDKIKEKLRKYPSLISKEEEGSISVTPPNGFTVSLYESTDDYTVGYDGWHEEFASEDEALNCFAFGLSKECRLKIYSRGGMDYKWIVEYLHEGEWQADSTTGLIFFPFWRRLSVTYKYNEVIGS
ncbi:hypothetical protein NBRC116493_02810 [Aurantivibrio infirmus]